LARSRTATTRNWFALLVFRTARNWFPILGSGTEIARNWIQFLGFESGTT